MKRFNFFCHGLLWIAEEGDDLLLLIPEIETHRYFHGQPDLGLDALIPLAPGADWRLTGPPSSRLPLLSLVSTKHTLALRRSEFTVDPGMARNRIRIPKPNLVRTFRATEVTQKMLGTTPASAVHRVPQVSHDVIAFSYIVDDVLEAVTLQGPGGETHVISDLVASSWCLYSQPSDPEPAGHDITDMNRILRFKGTTTHPDFQLALATSSDGPHDVAKAKGFGQTHLLSLLELKHGVSTPESSRAGCHAALLAD